MKLRFKVASFLAAMFLAFVSPKPCSAAAVTDPPNDFLPSYTGPHNGDLDVVAANVTLAESNFDFTATFNDVIAITRGVAYVFGINRVERVQLNSATSGRAVCFSIRPL